MSLRHEEIEDLAGGRFSIECPRLVLVNHEGHEQYVGAGEIALDDAGQLRMVQYVPGHMLDLDDDFGTAGLEAGDFIPQTEWYRVEADDLRGRCWEADSVQPEVSGVLGNKGVVVRGELRELTSTREPPADGEERLWMQFNSDLRLPVNKATETLSKSVRGEARSFAFDHWLVRNERHELLFKTRESGFDLEAQTADTLTQGFDTRIEEALWFVFGRLLHWSVLEEVRDGTQRTTIRSRIPEIAAGFWAPYELQRSGAADIAGGILLRYLSFIEPYEEPRYHPLSVHVRRVIRARTASAEEQALALAVAVEGLVGEFFSEWGEEPREVIDAIDAALAHFDEGEGYEAITHRVSNALQNMKGANSRTALRKLAEAGVVTAEGWDVWNELRHPATHGAEYDMPFRELVEKVTKLHRLFLQVVFRAIGYTGQYTDRGTIGWPTVEMEPHPDV